MSTNVAMFQCCGSGRFIPDPVHPGSRIPYLGSWLSDLEPRISDLEPRILETRSRIQQQQQQQKGWGKICFTFFVATN